MPRRKAGWYVLVPLGRNTAKEITFWRYGYFFLDKLPTIFISGFPVFDFCFGGIFAITVTFLDFPD